MLNGKILFVRSCSYVPLLLLCIGGHISGLCFLCHLYGGGGGGGEYAQKTLDMRALSYDNYG